MRTMFVPGFVFFPLFAFVLTCGSGASGPSGAPQDVVTTDVPDHDAPMDVAPDDLAQVDTFIDVVPGDVPADTLGDADLPLAPAWRLLQPALRPAGFTRSSSGPWQGTLTIPSSPTGPRMQYGRNTLRPGTIP